MTVQGNVLGFPILSLITFLPLVGAILLLMVGREQIRSLRNLALLVSRGHVRRLPAGSRSCTIRPPRRCSSSSGRAGSRASA